jgi:hypothetical protein
VLSKPAKKGKPKFRAKKPVEVVPFVLNPFARQKALDRQRLVDTGVLCRSKFARLFNSVQIKTGAVCEINCKSWRCKRHRLLWGYKWHRILEDRLKELRITLLVNLTTAEFVDHEVIHKALRRFMRLWRDHFGATEYIRMTEYNKNHTQPHFHFLVSCPSLKFAPMPGKFRTKEGRKLSYPENVFYWISQTWGDCLEYFAPAAKRTTVVWCQPPASAAASAKYAVNYITGKNSEDKDEEPDDTWGGRKVCYSKGFFEPEKPAMQIWRDYLVKKFGVPDPDDKFFWQPNDSERITGENPLDFQHMPVMFERFKLAIFYKLHGRWPGLGEDLNEIVYSDLYYENLGGQDSFNTEERGKYRDLRDSG